MIEGPQANRGLIGILDGTPLKLAKELLCMLKSNRYNIRLHAASFSHENNSLDIIGTSISFEAEGCIDDQKSIHVPYNQLTDTYTTLRDKCYAKMKGALKEGLSPVEYPNKIVLEFYDPNDRELSDEIFNQSQ